MAAALGVVNVGKTEWLLLKLTPSKPPPCGDDVVHRRGIGRVHRAGAQAVGDENDDVAAGQVTRFQQLQAQRSSGGESFRAPTPGGAPLIPLPAHCLGTPQRRRLRPRRLIRSSRTVLDREIRYSRRLMGTS